MYILAIFLPFILSLNVLFFGKFLGNKGINLLVNLGMFTSLMMSCIIFNEIIINNSITFINMYKWIDLGYFIIDINLYFDTLTSIMLIIVCTISLLVHIYSTEYMSHDINLHRFMSYLSLFTFFMLLLVSADNYLLLFIGWEGVGLSSYLLINFWYLRILANKAAIKAMLVNRIGDLSLLIGISIIFYYIYSLKYIVIFNIVTYILQLKFILFIMNINIITIICLFLFIGAMGKSAQLGLHIWLPDAMEGPTPVSALIHAATMVTAGVFLVIRSSFLFEHTYNILIFISIIGGLTSLFSGLIGVFQFDIKKIVAYSTCSQLGYMFFSCGMSNYNVGLFHLFNHAFFKALLFLSMGSIIHALCDEQDIRRMGGLIRYLPITYILVLIGTLSLLAFPFLTGYYSKDFLLEFVYSLYNVDSLFIYFIGVFAAMFTAFYSCRLIYWVFFAKINFFKIYTSFLNELNLFMLIPMIFLSFFSILIGYIFFDSFLGIGSIFWNNSIFISLLHYTILDAEFSLFYIKFIPLIFTLLGIIFFFLSNKFLFFYLFKILFNNKVIWYIFYFFNKSLYFDNIINNYFVLFILKFSYISIYKYIEKGILELFGPIIIYKILYSLYNIVKQFNDGLIFNYIFIILWFIIYFIIIFEFIIKFELINLFLNFIIILFILYFIYKYYNIYFLIINYSINIENIINKKYYIDKNNKFIKNKFKLFIIFIKTNKMLIFNYFIQIVIISILLFLIKINYTSILNLWLILFLFLLIIIMRRLYKVLLKEIYNHNYIDHNYIFVYISLIITNISIFIFFFIMLYINNKNDILGINIILKNILNFLHINEYSFIIRVGILIFTIIIYYYMIYNKNGEIITEIKLNEKDEIFWENEIKPFILNLPKIYVKFCELDWLLSIFYFWVTLIMTWILLKNINIYLYFLIILIWIIFSTIIVFYWIYSIKIDIKYLKLIYKKTYKPNPGPDWFDFFRTFKEYQKKNLQITPVDFNTFVKINKRILFVFSFIWGAYYIAETTHGRIWPNKKFPPNEKLEDFGRKITELTGYGKDDDFFKPKKKD